MKILGLLVFLAQIQPNNLVQPLGGTPQLLIPAAGSVQGANGTFFRSDIDVINFTTHDQRVQLRWLPQGTTGNGIAIREIMVSAASGFSSEDFVSTVMAQSGLGSILVTGVTADGGLDPTARLFATSRIWSNQPNLSSGTVSQSFPSVPASTIDSTFLRLIGLRRDDRYRLNVGVINLDPLNAQTFQIIAASSSSSSPEVTTVTVQPMSMMQSSLVGVPLENLQIAVQNVSTGARTNSWYVYGSSVDNTTGDAWSEVGFTAPPDETTP